jgi:hypothetical protein
MPIPIEKLERDLCPTRKPPWLLHRVALTHAIIDAFDPYLHILDGNSNFLNLGVSGPFSVEVTTDSNADAVSDAGGSNRDLDQR